MYTLSVPIMNRTFIGEERKNFLARFRETGATRVFLALDPEERYPERDAELYPLLRENIAILHENGFEAGVWIWTFMVDDPTGFVTITPPDGAPSQTEACPSDEGYRRLIAAHLQKIAACKPDLILFDDDFRYGVLNGGKLGCVCKNHRAKMEELLGKSLEGIDLCQTLFAGGENEIRSAFLRANAFWFKQFAKEMRQTIDAVDPQIRLGLCACMDVWDFDGISPYELSLLLAGGTKPFLRLIGAPYWFSKHSWGNRLQDVIELERMERAFCGDGAEIVSEGDSYPRPRFNCPASYLELFDLNLHASGKTDGILKYLFDYTSSCEYERGYYENHLRNLPLSNGIDDLFGKKESVGIRVYEKMRKFETAEIPAEVAGTSRVEELFFSPAAKVLSANGFPSVYEGYGVAGIAFGENARGLEKDAFTRGLILDLRAAEILTASGVDVGLRGVLETVSPTAERFSSQKETVAVYKATAKRTAVAERAVVDSTFTLRDGTTLPASYRYENAEGQKFLVFLWNGYFNGESLWRNYARARQIADTIRDFFGTPLPAYTAGNPDVYLQCKRAGEKAAVAVSNCSADWCFAPKIVTDRPIKHIRFLNSRGKTDGNQVILDDLPPFSFCAFEIF